MTIANCQAKQMNCFLNIYYDCEGIEEIGIHGAIHFQLFAKNGSTLNITVSTDCLRETSPNCTTAVFFITKDELKEFANHTLDLNKLTFPHIYNASTIDTVATLSENMDYVVIYNINNDTRTRADYKLAYFPPLGREVCFTALGSSIGVVVVVLLTLCLCCLGPKKEIFDDADGMNIPDYPYKRPHTVECMRWCTIPCWEEQINGFKYYWLQMDQVFWIIYPERNESLNLVQRIIVTITFLFFHLMLQIFWNQIFISRDFIYEIADDTPKYLAFLVLRIFSSGTVIWVLAKIYRPFIRFVAQPKPIWHDSPSQAKRVFGQIFKFTGVFVLIGVIVYTTLALYWTLQTYLCSYIWFQIIVPFLGTVIVDNVIIGTPTRYCGYVMKNTCGKRVNLDEQRHLLPIREKPKRRGCCSCCCRPKEEQLAYKYL
jgi:hypothetical protein